MTEIPQFTMEDVLRVSKVPAPHPVVEVLDQNSAQIGNIMDQAKTMHSAEASRFIAVNMCFLADPTKQIGAFTLEPLDLVAIGVRLNQLPRFRSFDTPVNYVTHIICTSYVTHGLSNPGWDQLPTYYLEDIDRYSRYRNLPPSVLDDRAGLFHAQQRNNNIGASLDELKKVVYAEKTDILPVVNLVVFHFGHHNFMIGWDLQTALARLNTGST